MTVLLCKIRILTFLPCWYYISACACCIGDKRIKYNAHAWGEAYAKTLHTYEKSFLNDDQCKVSRFLSNEGVGSRSQIEKLCKEGVILVNNQRTNGGRLLRKFDLISVTKNSCDQVDDLKSDTIVNSLYHLISQEANQLRIIYEDDHIAVVNKPSGIHSLKWVGSMSRREVSLDEVLPLLLYPPAHDALKRPLPAHRLDFRVSGCLIITKSQLAAVSIGHQFEKQSIIKEYVALLVGNLAANIEQIRQDIQHVQIISDPPLSLQSMDFNSSSTYYSTAPLSINISIPINGRPASTQITILQLTPCAVYGWLSTVLVTPQTGRRHQIRQHCAMLGTPILGDDLYHDAALQSSHRSRVDAVTCIGSSFSEGNRKSTSEVPNTAEEVSHLDGEDDDRDDDIDDIRNVDALVDSVTSVASMKGCTTSSSSSSSSRRDGGGTPDDSLHKGYPAVRRGVGLFLSCTRVQFLHPATSAPINAQINEPEKFENIRQKARKGWIWEQSQ